jgi:hypothetical protein
MTNSIGVALSLLLQQNRWVTRKNSSPPCIRATKKIEIVTEGHAETVTHFLGHNLGKRFAPAAFGGRGETFVAGVQGTRPLLGGS